MKRTSRQKINKKTENLTNTKTQLDLTDTPPIFSDYNGMKLGIYYRNENGKRTNTCRLTNMLLNDKWVKEEFNGKSKNTLRQTKMEM